MPFDGEIKPPPAPVVRPKSGNERWDYVPNRELRPRRGFNPTPDIDALYRVIMGIHTKWSKQLNGPDGTHCVVGWLVNACEPMTLIDYRRPQTQRLLQRLHNALPKSAQRKSAPHQITLANYNDTHSRDAVYRVAVRAYTSLVNDLQGST